jgi:hypothetical protein
MEAKTEKIKVTVNTEEVKELEISFPYYVKDGGLCCKFFNRSVAIWVSEYGFKSAIEYSNGAVPESWITFQPITESEFNEQFNEVMTALIDINNEKTI